MSPGPEYPSFRIVCPFVAQDAHLVGLVTKKSSPTICVFEPSDFVMLTYPSQSFYNTPMRSANAPLALATNMHSVAKCT